MGEPLRLLPTRCVRCNRPLVDGWTCMATPDGQFAHANCEHAARFCGPVVICGSTSQLPALAALASTYAQDGRDVLYPQDSDRPGPDLDREWMDAIPGASLVVVLRKPDGSLGSQTTAEAICAVAHSVPVHWWMPPGVAAWASAPPEQDGPGSDSFNPAYRVARCGQQSAHRPHVMEHGPDEPRNCPGVGTATTEGAPDA